MQNQNQSTVKLVGLLFMVWVFLPGILYAQTLTVSGKVIDAETHEPLAYATVGLKDAPYATITNLAGEFDFHLPAGHKNGMIEVSMLGYQNFLLPVEIALEQNILLVILKPGRIMLDEVLVSERLSAANLLRIAIARIELNYPMTPVEMQGFYRDIKKADNEYVGLIEAALRIYDKNYKKPRDHTKLRERVALVEVRRTVDYDYKLEKYFNKYNMLEDLLLENLVKYRTFNESAEFYSSLQRKTVPGYDNKPINLVTIDQPGYHLKIYIDDHYGIRKIVFNWGDGSTPVYRYRKSRKLEHQVMALTKEIEFQEIDGKLYLKYIAATYKNRWVNRKTMVVEKTTERQQALFINKVNYTNPQWITHSEKMKRYGLQYQHKAYNKEFWENYNIIKEMPLNSKVLYDLEKIAALKEQFESFE